MAQYKDLIWKEINKNSEQINQECEIRIHSDAVNAQTEKTGNKSASPRGDIVERHPHYRLKPSPKGRKTEVGLSENNKLDFMQVGDRSNYDKALGLKFGDKSDV